MTGEFCSCYLPRGGAEWVGEQKQNKNQQQTTLKERTSTTVPFVPQAHIICSGKVILWALPHKRSATPQKAPAQEPVRQEREQHSLS